MTVIGHLGSLVLVICLLGTTEVLAQIDANTPQALCERIHQNPQNLTFQAVSPLADKLYLISQDILYTVPFTGDSIDSIRGRMALNSTEPGTEWTQVPWLKSTVVNASQHPVLVRMSIWVEPTGHSDPSKDHSINVIYQFPPSDELHLAWINPNGRKIPFHGVVTDGAIGQVQFPHKAVLYKFHKSEWCQPLLVILQDASSDEMYLSLGSDNQNSSNMQIRANSCPDRGTRPVLTWSPVYGFIHSRVVHLWDTQNGRVILFDYIANSPYDPITVQVMFVPFREYFVCKRTSDYVDGMLHWVVLVILVILGAAGVGAFYWCYKNRQSRFAKNGSKGKANKSTTLKSQAPSTTGSIRLESTRPSSSRISSTKAPFKMETFTDLGKITKTTTTTPKMGGKSLQVKSILNANGEMWQSTAPGLNPFQAFMVSSNVEGLSSAVSGVPKVPNKIQDCAKSRISSSSIASSSGLIK